jgi:poly(A) polymerase
MDHAREGALDVIRTLRAAGHEALFAGGCVRDQVLGVPPKDWDIATSARPEAVLDLFPKAIPVGVQFGVVRVIVHGREYEVATFRADGAYVDGRRPESVVWSSAEEDVRRRDFTINGLLQDPMAEGGRVLDYVGGLADLEQRVIRAIGEPTQRFEEDYLRILRAVRFAARLDFAIDGGTWDAMKRLAPTITRVSQERIREELDRLFSEGGAARGVTLAHDAGLLPHILAELSPLEPALARLRHLGRTSPLLGWALALWDAGPQPADLVVPMGQRLKMSRHFVRDLTELIETGHALSAWEALAIAARKRALRRATGPIAVVLAGLAGHASAEHAAKRALQDWTEADLHPPALITGEDLKRLGFSPGPPFKRALESVETAQLEGLLTHRDDALALAARRLTET